MIVSVGRLLRCPAPRIALPSQCRRHGRAPSQRLCVHLHHYDRRRRRPGAPDDGAANDQDAVVVR